MDPPKRRLSFVPGKRLVHDLSEPKHDRMMFMGTQ